MCRGLGLASKKWVSILHASTLVASMEHQHGRRVLSQRHALIFSVRATACDVFDQKLIASKQLIGPIFKIK
jgi:hypothetical protein